MHKTTGIGCLQSIEQAIARLPPRTTFVATGHATQKNGQCGHDNIHRSFSKSPLLIRLNLTMQWLRRKGTVISVSSELAWLYTKLMWAISTAIQGPARVLDKSITETNQYPYLLGFPKPIQTLLVGKIQLFKKGLADGEPMPNHQSLENICFL